jgi:hypothetical protein
MITDRDDEFISEEDYLRMEDELLDIHMEDYKLNKRGITL